MIIIKLLFTNLLRSVLFGKQLCPPSSERSQGYTRKSNGKGASVNEEKRELNYNLREMFVGERAVR